MLCTENLNSTFIIKSKLVISKLLVSPLLSSTIVEQRPLVPFWGFCPPGTGEICRRPTDRREVNEGGVKTIEVGRGNYTIAIRVHKIKIMLAVYQ